MYWVFRSRKILVRPRCQLSRFLGYPHGLDPADLGSGDSSVLTTDKESVKTISSRMSSDGL
ncbi:Uncharacterized protein APZ42_029121 [Daphnia magna]|uniref:Uncharacterized protein n=1 Tax=Daphnia magna TaxID=35525 RepID=A0A164PWM5_9CRUS|nr:Uncharacterized protein APZ42_029121 [Daphnia magna]